MKDKDRILIYNDQGTECTGILKSAVLQCLPLLDNKDMEVDFVNATVLSESWEWFERTRLLIIPGGRDLPYCEQLTGTGNLAIREFVKRGGSYLGLCAGAYYASCYCEFERGTDMEVCGERELALFPGIATGCVYPGFVYGSCDGARMVRTAIAGRLQFSKHLIGQNIVKTYYNGGCELIINKDSDQSVDVLAYYNDFSKKVAIACCNFGHGKVIVSGVHPEMFFEFLDSDSFSLEKWKEMEELGKDQIALFTSLLSILI